MKQAMLLWLCAAAAWADGGPRIEFDRAVYDFGTTSLVESVSGTYIYTNTGDDVLKLDKPKPSCGCTVARLSRDQLNPGEQGELVFTLSLGTSPQEFAKVIFVSSNDPVRPVIELGLKAELKGIFDADPASVSFGDVRVGTTTNLPVLLTRTDGKNLTVTKLDSGSDLIKARAEPVENSDGKAARLVIEVKADGLPGLLSEQVRVFTADSTGAAFAIFVRAQLVSDIEVDPPELVWGMPDPKHSPDADLDELLSRSIYIISTKAEQSLLVRNVSCSLKEFSVELVTVEKDREYEIEVKLPKPLTQPVTGIISFETNLPDLPKVEVPLTVTIWTR